MIYCTKCKFIGVPKLERECNTNAEMITWLVAMVIGLLFFIIGAAIVGIAWAIRHSSAEKVPACPVCGSHRVASLDDAKRSGWVAKDAGTNS